MTTIPATSYAETPAAEATAATGLGRVLGVVEKALATLADRANPILVKETRQALKSRQFLVTFIVVLAACWIVSFAGVALIGPQIYYAATGPEMLIAYYTVLAFPLALIVPYTAFRSLASEQEDNTYDLLSITTLTSRQIITGKLCSAVVQMLVYLSAVSPCLAFTFLLRGVDALTTAMLLTIAVLGSLGLSIISLFIGATARVKHTQVITSVALVLALFGAFIGAVTLAANIVYEGIPRDAESWAIFFMLLMIYVTTFGLLHASAAAQISFASENRSTPVRRWMMAQQACFVGGLAGANYAFASGNDLLETTIVGSMMACMYWFIMGALMTSEWPHLSRRVQRSLPQSTFGRMFLSFFNPGPGSGYMFAVSNLTALVITALVVACVSPPMGWMTLDRVVCGLIIAWGYVVGYLGLGRLFIGFMRRWMFVSLTAGFLFHVLLVMAGVGIPLTIQMTSRAMRNDGYTLLQMTNPFWTTTELLNSGSGSAQAPILVLVVPGFAIAMLMLNMKSVASELRRHRVAPPVRVLEEEAELHPAPVPGPSNPWDADAVAES